jgi:cyclase
MRRVVGRGTAALAAVIAGVATAAWLMLVVTAPPAPAQQQRDYSKVEIKVTPVAGKIFMLEGAGGNIAASAGEDGVLIVDDEFEPLAPKIRAALAGLPGADRSQGGKVSFVINTHWHGDHTGSNKVFGAEAPIIAQTNVRTRLSTQQSIMGETIPPSPKVALPVITYDLSASVHFNGEEIKLLHVPHGHTDGDSVVFFTGSDVVHMGDDFFAGHAFPFVDLGSGGTVQGLIDSVGKVLAMLDANVKVIPGHGPLSTREDLKRYHDMLVETTGIVRKRMAAGESLEKIQAEGLPESFKPYGGGFIDTKTWILTIHDSLAKEKALPAAGR